MTRHCVITGAAQGIGRAALACRFAQAGYSITGIDIDQAAAKDCEQELLNADAQITFRFCDLSRAEEIRSLAQSLRAEPIDLLIHSAGISHVSPFCTSDLEQQIQVMKINLLAPMLLTEELGSEMDLVFISSLSHFVGYPGAAVYAASKDGLAAFARSLRDQGRYALTVFPGPTRTDHAKRYSPDNSREHRRMSPDKLADLIYRAVQKRKTILVPGMSNKFLAMLGRWFPWLTERILCKAILNKLQ